MTGGEYMANVLQKFIYNISSITPMLLIFSLVWKIQKGTNEVPVVLLSFSFLVMILFSISFAYAKKNLAPISIQTTEISPHDSWVICYIITYLLPMSGLVIDEWNISVTGIIAAVITILIPYINSAIPNPLLAIRGYHFYKVNAENGISEYVIISKRKYRNKKDLSVVTRIYEFLLLDKEG